MDLLKECECGGLLVKDNSPLSNSPSQTVQQISYKSEKEPITFNTPEISKNKF